MATVSISVRESLVAFIKASRCCTARSTGVRRPMSNAVRAGVVTGSPSTNIRSPSGRLSLHNVIPRGARRLV
ncbi:Uncharacterised protein [Mycobacteroides abscessus subsp. abscessus]|nr:Uncharacterised protein [Mycobacteroides abscessus subsp. abscessus]